MSSLTEALDERLRRHTGVDFDLLAFLLRQRLVGFEVPDAPHFDSPATTAWFSARLARAHKYLEYGTGGSTVLAARLGVPFVAVDSDKYFLRSVRRKVQREGFRASGQAWHYANIGLTGYWGRPLREWRRSARRLARFRRYSDPPPACYEGGRLPDFVLVDGRFRVACALKALRMLRHERDWTIVVDDYFNRPQYRAIERHAVLGERVGARMAVFCGARETTAADLDATIARFEVEVD